MPQRQARIGDVIGGRYELEEIVGEGGMAVVFRARNSGTKRVCAVKIVRPKLLERPELMEMFVREAQVGNRVGDSPYIVDVRDAGIDDTTGVPFMVMELLKGEPLDQVIGNGSSDYATVAVLLSQLAEALDQAHAAGVVHRDLKPSNLFLTQDRSGAVLKVLDFGIAKLQENEAVKKTATHVGTPAYAAPEQLGRIFRSRAAKAGVAVADVVSPQTDVWAMGLIAYDLLTGYVPGQFWGAESAFDFPELVLEGALPASERAGEREVLLPEGFDAWLARCLEREAPRRWESAGAAAAASAGLGAGQRALPAGAGETKRKAHRGGKPQGSSNRADGAQGATPVSPHVQTSLASAGTMVPETAAVKTETPTPPPAAPARRRRPAVVAGGLIVGLAALAAVAATTRRDGDGPSAMGGSEPSAHAPKPDEIKQVPITEISKEFKYKYFADQYFLIRGKIEFMEETKSNDPEMLKDIDKLKKEYNNRAEGIDPAIFEAHILPCKM